MVADPHPLANRFTATEKILGKKVTEEHDPTLAFQIEVAEVTALVYLPAHDYCRRRDLLAGRDHGLGVLQPQTLGQVGALDIEIRGRRVGADEEHPVQPEGLDPVPHLHLHCLDQGDHKDHRKGAEDDPYQGQRRSQLVRPNLGERRAQGFSDDHQTSLVTQGNHRVEP